MKNCNTLEEFSGHLFDVECNPFFFGIKHHITSRLKHHSSQCILSWKLCSNGALLCDVGWVGPKIRTDISIRPVLWKFMSCFLHDTTLGRSWVNLDSQMIGIWLKFAARAPWEDRGYIRKFSVVDPIAGSWWVTENVDYDCIKVLSCFCKVGLF